MPRAYCAVFRTLNTNVTSPTDSSLFLGCNESDALLSSRYEDSSPGMKRDSMLTNFLDMDDWLHNMNNNNKIGSVFFIKVRDQAVLRIGVGLLWLLIIDPECDWQSVPYIYGMTIHLAWGEFWQRLGNSDRFFIQVWIFATDHFHRTDRTIYFHYKLNDYTSLNALFLSNARIAEVIANPFQ